MAAFEIARTRRGDFEVNRMFVDDVARQLFAPPGACGAHTRHLLAQAAAAHARLLNSASAARQAPLDRLRAALSDYLRGPVPSSEKRFVLDDPLLVEALHALAGASDDLSHWDAAVAPGCYHAPAEQARALARGRLGNVVAAVALRRARDWCGQIELATDDYGRVHMPFSDWVLALVDQRAGERDLFAHRTVVLSLDDREARWSLPARAMTPLVRMPRALFNAMFVENGSRVDAGLLEFGAGPPCPRFERVSRLGNTRIRFEPIAPEGPPAHAELTGSIVAALLSAIESNSPRIHTQLCQCIRTIHGFELPPYGQGRIASFSVPTSPGIIGFNVEFTERDEPRISPYAFMWLGHELGHTLHYLIDDVAFTHGWRFVENPGDSTPAIPRYGRALSVRTLCQVPYVHLFEWWLLISFHEHGFRGLPWEMTDDSLEVGDDLRDEIFESFEWIDQHARLTDAGRAMMARMRELVADAHTRWRQVTNKAA
jgi:hypothetical protein